MKKILAILLTLAMFIIPVATVSVSAAESDDVNLMTDVTWTEEHKWTWDGDSFNAETGAVKDVVTGDWAEMAGTVAAGSYSVADGILTTNGNATWALPETISYDPTTTDYLRVEWKGTFTNTANGIYRVLHGNKSGLSTLGAIAKYNLGGRDMNTYAIQLGNDYMWIYLADQDNFVNKEHKITMIFAKGMMNLYVDDVYVGSNNVAGRYNANLNDWEFHHLMGYQINQAAGAFQGKMDYVSISTGVCEHSNTSMIYAATRHGEVCNVCGEAVNAVAHESTECDVCGFVGAPSAADALASEDWTATNRWDFNDNLDDSIGGATVTNVRGSATYQDGKVVLSGTNAWKFDKAINIGGLANGLVGMRVDMKATIDWTKSGALRVLGGASGTNAGLLFWLGAAGDLANKGSTGGIGFCPITTQAYAQVLPYDEVQFDRTAEHTYTCIYYIDHIYHYIDGVLVAEKELAGSANDFEVTDFLGCTYAGADIAGTIDFIELSVIEGSAKPADDNTDTGVTLIVLPVALAATAGVVATSRKRRNSK